MKGRTTSAPKTAKSIVAATSAAEASPLAKQPPTSEEIARRSYEIYLGRGGTDGHAEEDWLAAERELGA